MPQPAASMSAASLIRHFLLGTTALLPVTLIASPGWAQAPNAAPVGGQVSAGSATISQSATTTRIDQTSTRAAIDWQRFDVGRNQTVQFNQPNAASWTLNRVNSPDPSLIAGSITANGGVAIVNQSGVVFGAGSQVNVGSLIASAAGITNQNFMAGRMVFDQPANPGARVENHGQITVAERGLAALAAPGVANSGTIRARLGRVALAGAETFTLDLAGDGLVSLDVTGSVQRTNAGTVALVTNTGMIDAVGGSVLLTADAARGVVDTLIRNTGRISADADAGGGAGQVAIRGGAGGDVRISAGVVSAAGTAPGTRGGTVEVSSRGGSVAVARGARVDASGTAGGGTARVGGATTRRTRVAGEVSARGAAAGARGGTVVAQATESVTVASTGRLDASGAGGGGTVLAGTTGIGRAQTMAARTTVEAGATLVADATVRGTGGTIAVNSTERTDVAGALSARGGATGGDGGFIEVSGQHSLALSGHLSLDAPLGQGGTLLIDPDTINIVAAGGDAGQPPVGGTVTFASDPNNDGIIDINAGAINSFTAGVTVLLQANNAINVNAAINRTTAGALQLETGAAGAVTVSQPVTLTSGMLGIRTGTLNVNAAMSTSGDAIVTAGSVAVGATGSISGATTSLRADSFTLNGAAVLVGTTAIEFGPTTSSAFTFVPANGVSITTPTLRLGETSGDRSWGATPDAATVTANSLTVASAISRPASDIELIGGSVAVNAAVTAPNMAIIARTGDITQTAAVSTTSLTAVAAGGVALGGLANAVTNVGGSAGTSFAFRDVDGFDVTGITVGTVAGNTVTLTADAGNITQSATITGGALTATAGGGVNLGTQANALATIGGAAGTDFAFRDADGFSITGINAGTAAGNTVTLTADTGDITQDGTIAGGALTATASGGIVSLGTQANAVASIGGSVGTNFAFRDADGFDVTGITAGTAAGSTVTLTADAGNITQSATITGGALTATAGGGIVSLGTQANAVTSAGGSAGTNFAFRNADGFDVTGITAGTVAGNTVTLTADAGDITQSATITGGALTAAAADVVNLGTQANAVASIGGSTGTSFAFRDADGFDVTGISTGTVAGNTVTLTADTGDITQSATITGDALTATANGGAVNLGTQANALITIGGTAGTNFAFRDADGFDVTGITAGTVAGNTVMLTADTGSIAQTGAITGGALTATAAGGVVGLGTVVNAVTAAGGTAGVNFTLRDVDGFDVTGITAGNTVTLTADAGSITQSNTGRIAASTLSARAGDAIILTAFDGSQVGAARGNVIGSIGTLMASGGAIALRLVQAPVTVTGPLDAATGITLNSEGSLTLPSATVRARGGDAVVQAGGALTATSATVTASGSVNATAGGDLSLASSSVTAAGGDATLRSEAALRMTGGGVSAPGTASITAPSGVALSGTVIDSATVLVRADTGRLDASNVTATASGTMTFSAAGPGGVLRLSGGIYTADYIVLVAGQTPDAASTISFSGSSFRVGTAMLAAAGGGVGLATDGSSSVQPLNTSALPLVILETRRDAAALRGLSSGIFTASSRDVSGSQPASQPWQVANIRGGNPGLAFGVTPGSGPASSANPAGNVILNLDAGSSPVFLLLNGGAASGNLVAGRLGVVGQQGRPPEGHDTVVDLTGSLFGQGGTSAARFGRMTSSSPIGQSLYRMNNCVLDTVNCVATSLAQPLAIPLSSRVDIRFDLPRLDPDVLLPNIAEEDY